MPDKPDMPWMTEMPNIVSKAGCSLRKLAHAIYRGFFSAVKIKKKNHCKNSESFNIFDQNIDCGYTF